MINDKFLLGDFKGQIDKEIKFRKIVAEYPVHKRTNKNGERVKDCRGFNLKLMSTYLQKLPRKRTWKSPNLILGEFQMDHVALLTSKKSRM